MRNRHALEPMVLPSQAFCDCWYSPSTVDEVENICARPSNLARIPPGRLTSRNYESALFPTFSELQLFVHFMRLEHPVRIAFNSEYPRHLPIYTGVASFTGITSVQFAAGDAKRCGPGLLRLSFLPQCKPISEPNLQTFRSVGLYIVRLIIAFAPSCLRCAIAGLRSLQS